jgi:hypothetical protein
MSFSQKKHKVVVFDVDETLGNFSQFSIFCHVIDTYFNQDDISYRYFNDLVDLYPEMIRPNMVRILDYIRKKKNTGVCRKVIIYTNNMGPDKWVTHIRRYFEHKLRLLPQASASASTPADTTAIIPPLFDHLIGGFKPNAERSEATSNTMLRTTNEKTMNDLIYCARLPANIEVCFLDDVFHKKMTDDRVYYIKLQPYYTHIPFETFVVRFLNSRLFREVFDKIDVPSITHTMPVNIKKQILSIELHDLFVKYANMSKYDAKTVQRKTNPREIDEIISKYILYHLQEFFRDGPPQPKVISNASTDKARRITAKKKGSSTYHHSRSNHNINHNIFYVDKTSAVKNIHNNTVRIR